MRLARYSYLLLSLLLTAWLRVTIAHVLVNGPLVLRSDYIPEPFLLAIHNSLPVAFEIARNVCSPFLDLT